MDQIAQPGVDEIHLHFWKMAKEHLQGIRLLIAALENYTDLQDQRVHWDARGKPSLPESAYAVSISHSRDLGLVALARTEQLGCDLQFHRPKTPAGILEKYFNPREVMVWAAQGQDDLFYRLWCLKESHYKATTELLGESLIRDFSWVKADQQAELPDPDVMVDDSFSKTSVQFSEKGYSGLHYWTGPLSSQCQLALALRAEARQWYLRCFCHTTY